MHIHGSEWFPHSCVAPGHSPTIKCTLKHGGPPADGGHPGGRADTPAGGGQADKGGGSGGALPYATDGHTCLRYGGREDADTEGAPTWRQGKVYQHVALFRADFFTTSGPSNYFTVSSYKTVV